MTTRAGSSFCAEIPTCLVGLLSGFFLLAESAHSQTYDSRIESEPHELSWVDQYRRVELYQKSTMEITGGFVSFLRLEDEANLIVHDGFLDSVVARGHSRIHLEKLHSTYFSVGDEALMTIAEGIQPRDGEALAGGNGLLKIGGGPSDGLTP
jgi:hypothetical protein